jgi:hypothetical protein
VPDVAAVEGVGVVLVLGAEAAVFKTVVDLVLLWRKSYTRQPIRQIITIKTTPNNTCKKTLPDSSRYLFLDGFIKIFPFKITI